MSAIRMEATLAANAEARVTVDGLWCIFYEFRQDGRKAGLIGTQRIGTGDAAAISAKAKAGQLKRGQGVRIFGAGLEREALQIRVVGIDHVEAIATTHMERAA